MLPLVLVLGLAAGYVGANWQKDDPSKTARNTRNGARSGLIVGIAGIVGRSLVGLILPAEALTVLDYCLIICGDCWGAGVGRNWGLVVGAA